MVASLTNLFDGVFVFSIGAICGGVASLLFREVILGWFKSGKGN